MQNKQTARRGFTLVEVIVVLVILAILAAIMIPAMTGWIDKAKQKRLIVACRTCVNAAQTLVSETYGQTGNADVPAGGDVIALARVPGSASNITLANTAVNTLTYTDAGGGEYVTYKLTPEPHYEFGAGSFGQAATLVTIQDTFNNAGATRYDSGAASLGGFTDQVLALLKTQNIDLAAMNATSWRFNKSAQQLYWTDVDIAKLAVGTEIPVMRYNFATGTYTVWKAKVEAHTANVNGTLSTYNAIGNIIGSQPIGTKDQANQTYEQMLADYAAKKPEYNLGG